MSSILPRNIFTSIWEWDPIAAAALASAASALASAASDVLITYAGDMSKYDRKLANHIDLSCKRLTTVKNEVANWNPFVEEAGESSGEASEESSREASGAGKRLQSSLCFTY
ncbi:unnamed protein product [Arabis nemorensis]|uniref:Uncharacterized protein n=1 Tax=Arabis nemorensis TaxID=586526 RepID=A0A565BRM5_9BRAS|nr:unnamed protein product [Arabis nemorensis]